MNRATKMVSRAQETASATVSISFNLNIFSSERFTSGNYFINPIKLKFIVYTYFHFLQKLKNRA